MSTAFTDAEVESLSKFIGYGSTKAPVWFLGMEEAGGGEANLRARLKFNEIEDLCLAHQKLDIRCFHEGPLPKIQRTWRGMSHVMLYLNGQKPDLPTVREYQSKQLGRFDGKTFLLELLPIPKPALTSWDYVRVLPQFPSRDAYYDKVKPQRIRTVRRLIAKHDPELLVAYGKRYWADFRQLFPDVPFCREGQFEWAISGRTFVALSDHFTAPSMNGKFEELANLIQIKGVK